MSIKHQKQLFMHKVQMMMLKILIIFGLPAGIGYGVGQWLDSRFFTRPNGSMLALGVSFLFSWVIVIIMYSKLEKERILLEEKEDEEKEKRQEEIKKKLQENQ